MTGVQHKRGAVTRDGDHELDNDLGRWTEAGVITAEQAEAIRIIEAEEAQRKAPGRIPLIAQALGFLGGALAVIAGMVATARFWDEFSTAARLIVVGGVGVILVAAGRVVRRQAEPALEHLGSFLWVLAVGAFAGWSAILSLDVIGWEGADVALAVGVVASVAALGLWAWRPAPLQHVVALTAVAVTVAGVAGQVRHVGGLFIGIALWALGALWLTAAWRGLVKPTALGYAAGGVLTIVAGRVIGDEGAWSDILTITTALALLGASVPTRSMVLLWVGVIGVFISVPIAVTQHFGDSLGAPVVLFLVGMSLIGVAVGASRLVREVQSAPPKERTFSPTTITGAIIGAVALVLGLTVALTDIKPIPTFASLRQTPDTSITGSIAFLRDKGGDKCVYVTAASGVGTERKLLCANNLEQSPAALDWNPAGHLLVHQFSPNTGPVQLEIDPTDGRVLDRRIVQDFGKGPVGKFQRADGASVDAVNNGRGKASLQLRTADGATRTLLTMQGPRDFRLENATWSADGRYVVVTDSEHRLLVVDVESPSPTARLLVGNATAPAWSE